MERGSSQSWSQILQESIGEGRLSGQALRDYFQPLEDWLRSENLRTGEYLGWSYDGDYCKFRYTFLKFVGMFFSNRQVCLLRKIYYIPLLSLCCDAVNLLYLRQRTRRDSCITMLSNDAYLLNQITSRIDQGSDKIVVSYRAEQDT